MQLTTFNYYLHHKIYSVTLLKCSKERKIIPLHHILLT